VRAAFIHMAGDAGVSAGVVIAGLIIMATGWNWIDPLVSLAIAIVILWSTWSLARASVAMALSAVPPSIDPAKVRAALLARPGVAALHDLHIWPMSTTETSLTAHLFMPAGFPGDAFLMATCEALHRDFGIGHVTLQVETSADTDCALAPEDVV
jgi:cobalt-zinc-cadmium efflux system protein